MSSHWQLCTYKSYNYRVNKFLCCVLYSYSYLLLFFKIYIYIKKKKNLMFISSQEYVIFNSESFSVQSERERVKLSFKVLFPIQFFMDDHPQPVL